VDSGSVLQVWVLDGEDIVDPHVHARGVFEDVELDTAAVKPGDIVLDVGSYIGSFTSAPQEVGRGQTSTWVELRLVEARPGGAGKRSTTAAATPNRRMFAIVSLDVSSSRTTRRSRWGPKNG
jgi:hypothetical protein